MYMYESAYNLIKPMTWCNRHNRASDLLRSAASASAALEGKLLERSSSTVS